MYRTTVCVLLMALLAVTTVWAATPDSSVVLPDSIQIKILELEAAGKFTEADSLKRSATAQVLLEARKAKAQTELDKKKAEEAKESEKKMWAEVDSIRKEFAKKDIFALIEISKYDADFHATQFAAAMLRMGIPKQAIDLKTPSDDYPIMLRTAAMIYYGTVQLNGTAHQKLQADITAASADTNNGITEALVDLTGRVESLEEADELLAGQILEVKSNMELLREAVNKNGVNVTACLELLKSAKYEKNPKQASKVEEAVSNASHNYDAVEFKLQAAGNK